MVGRSTSITGPCVDQKWRPADERWWNASAGDERYGDWAGGEDVLGNGYLAYHFYDARRQWQPETGDPSVTYPGRLACSGGFETVSRRPHASARQRLLGGSQHLHHSSAKMHIPHG